MAVAAAAAAVATAGIPGLLINQAASIPGLLLSQTAGASADISRRVVNTLLRGASRLQQVDHGWETLIVLWKIIWADNTATLEDIIVAFNTGHTILLKAISNFFLESLISGSKSFRMTPIDISMIFAPSVLADLDTFKIETYIRAHPASARQLMISPPTTSWDLGELAKLFVIQIRYYHNFLIEKNRFFRETSTKIKTRLTNDMVFYGHFARSLTTLRFATTLLYHFYVNWFDGNSEVDSNLSNDKLQERQTAIINGFPEREDAHTHLTIDHMGSRLRDTVNRARLESQFDAFIVELQSPNTLEKSATNNIQFLSVLNSNASAEGTLKHATLFAQYVHYLNRHATLFVLDERVKHVGELVQPAFLRMEAAFSQGSVYKDMNSPLVKVFSFMEVALGEDISYLVRQTGLAGPVKNVRSYPKKRNASTFNDALVVDWTRSVWSPIRTGLGLYSQFALSNELLTSTQAFTKVQLTASAVRLLNVGTRDPIYDQFDIPVEVELWRQVNQSTNRLASSELLRSSLEVLLTPLLYGKAGEHRTALLEEPTLVMELVVVLLYQVFLQPAMQVQFPNISDESIARNSIPLGEAMNNLFIGLNTWKEAMESSNAKKESSLLSHFLQLTSTFPDSIRDSLHKLETREEDGEGEDAYLYLWNLGYILMRYAFVVPTESIFLTHILLDYLAILTSTFHFSGSDTITNYRKYTDTYVKKTAKEMSSRITQLKTERNTHFQKMKTDISEAIKAIKADDSADADDGAGVGVGADDGAGVGVGADDGAGVGVDADADADADAVAKIQTLIAQLGDIWNIRDMKKVQVIQTAITNLQRKNENLVEQFQASQEKENWMTKNISDWVDVLTNNITYMVLKERGLRIPRASDGTRDGLRVQAAIEDINKRLILAEDSLLESLQKDPGFIDAVLLIESVTNELDDYDAALLIVLEEPRHHWSEKTSCDTQSQNTSQRNALETGLQLQLNELVTKTRKELDTLLQTSLRKAELLRGEVLSLLDEIGMRETNFKRLVRSGILLH